MDSIPHKTCTRCKQAKPTAEFNRDKSRRDGYRDRCKACIRDYQREWLPNYVAKIQEQRQDTIAPETKRCTSCGTEKPLSEYHRTPNTIDGYRPVCKVCACAYQHAHRKNPRYAERVKAGDRRKYYAMPETERKQMGRRGHERHKSRYWSDPIFRAREMERSNTKVNNRRVKKAKNGGTHTTAEWRKLCEKYDHRCLRCGQVKRLTRDHIVPVEYGGSGDISNIQPLCLSCNSWKGTKTIDYRPVE